MAVVIAVCLAAPGSLHAQDDATEREVEKYRQMLKGDPWSNPGLLDADRGEALWKEKRGPKNASLEECDLGKGPGKVEGAFAELPRYFKDADRVMDAESRWSGAWRSCRASRAPTSSSVPTPKPTRPAGAGSARDLRRLQVERLEVRAAAR